MIQLKNEVINRIKEDEQLIFKIATHLHRKFRTVYRWILENDEMLTSPAVLAIIKTHLGLVKDADLIENVKQIA